MFHVEHFYCVRRFKVNKTFKNIIFQKGVCVLKLANTFFYGVHLCLDWVVEVHKFWNK